MKRIAKPVGAYNIFPHAEAAAAFDLLYNRLGETMAVLLRWDN